MQRQQTQQQFVCTTGSISMLRLIGRALQFDEDYRLLAGQVVLRLSWSSAIGVCDRKKPGVFNTAGLL